MSKISNNNRRKKNSGPCSVCEHPGSSQHFGVLACLPCAAFFRRYTVNKRNPRCHYDHKCDIKTEYCKGCRFRKCHDVGMDKNAVQKRRGSMGNKRGIKSSDDEENEVKIEMDEDADDFEEVDKAGSSKQDNRTDVNDGKCKVCNHPAASYHFGGWACKSCTSFFRRMVCQNKVPKCEKLSKCGIKKNRNVCQGCRLTLCLKSGMNKEEVQGYIKSEDEEDQDENVQKYEVESDNNEEHEVHGEDGVDINENSNHSHGSEMGGGLVINQIEEEAQEEAQEEVQNINDEDSHIRQICEDVVKGLLLNIEEKINDESEEEVIQNIVIWDFKRVIANPEFIIYPDLVELLVKCRIKIPLKKLPTTRILSITRSIVDNHEMNFKSGFGILNLFEPVITNNFVENKDKLLPIFSNVSNIMMENLTDFEIFDLMHACTIFLYIADESVNNGNDHIVEAVSLRITQLKRIGLEKVHEKSIDFLQKIMEALIEMNEHATSE